MARAKSDHADAVVLANILRTDADVSASKSPTNSDHFCANTFRLQLKPFKPLNAGSLERKCAHRRGRADADTGCQTDQAPAAAAARQGGPTAQHRGLD